MIFRWLTFFSLLSGTTFIATSAFGAQVSGRIALSDSRDPAVRNRRDYSGVVISLQPGASAPVAPLEPKKAVILQKDKTFSPHVLAIPVGTRVEFPNADPIFHNAFSSYNGQIFDIGLYPPGTTRSVRFAREGVVRVFCNIHSSMSAMIVVLGTPYYATTRKDGSFTIPNVPPGEYTLNVVHERATEKALASLARKIEVGTDSLTLQEMVISEAGFLSIPHKDKYGHEYSPAPPSEPYPETRR